MRGSPDSSPAYVHCSTALVFRNAQQIGVQIRGLTPRRETVEGAFLRVIGEAA
ncbi:MAG TPA: hypothetical protein VN253_22130 [Kofleriaceae bacterium]|nr:hypothetical protein [Kofleriaceae bacterium]